MTVTALPRSVVYSADGATTTFPVPFQFFEIRVYVGDVLVPSTDYVIAQAAPGLMGSITFTDAPVSPDLIVIDGETAIVQTTDYTEGDGFSAESHERALDRITMAQQELRRRYDLHPQLPSETPEVTPGINDNTYVYTIVDGKGYVVPASLLLAATNDPSGIGRAHNVGDMIYHAFGDAPAGWIRLFAEKQWVEKVNYPEYTKKCEEADWPYGHTTTHVGVPAATDFIRVWDDSENTLDPDAAQRRDNETGLDIVGNVIGSRQASELKSHTHTKPTVAVTVNSASVATTNHTHGVGNGTNVIRGNGQSVAVGRRFIPSVTISNSADAEGWIVEKVNLSTGSAGAANLAHAHTATTTVGNLGNTGGSETRPNNVAFPLIMLLRPGDAAASHSTMGLPYSFNADTDDDDPGSGYVKLDNADPTLATKLYVSNLTVFDAEPAELFEVFNANQTTQRGTVTMYVSGQLANSAVFRVIGDVVFEANHFEVPIAHVGGNGILSDNIPVSIMPVFDGARGLQGDPGFGLTGETGWSPVISVVTDGARRVQQVVEWTGGDGIPPDAPVYVGSNGFTTNIAEAVDIRGPAGASGGGTGTVVGPAISVIGNIAVFGDAGGEEIDDSGLALTEVTDAIASVDSLIADVLTLETDLTTLDGVALKEGKHTIPVSAVSMTPRITNGAARGSVELATNDIMVPTLDFDQTTEEGVGFWRRMPKSYDGGTITFSPIWTAASGSGGVVWSLAARAFPDDAAMDAAVGTAQTSTDTFLVANDMHTAPESAAITIAGTPAAGVPVYFELKRVTANGSDTLTADAKLIEINIHITLDKANDA
jgi:hypothetical protein